MTKLKFLLELHNKLSMLPNDEIEERLSFYSEMIEDRMEEGVSEEEAVSAVGSVDDIAEQIISEYPLVKLVKEKIKPKRNVKGWEIVLIILGFPVWFPLLAAIFSVVLAAFVTVWAAVISLWSVFVAFVGCFIGCLVGGIILIAVGNAVSGMLLIGSALIFAGMSVFAFFGCKALTKGIAWLTKKIFVGNKSAGKKVEA